MPQPSPLRLKGRAFVLGIGLIFAWLTASYWYLDHKRESVISRLVECPPPPPTSGVIEGSTRLLKDIFKRPRTDCEEQRQDQIDLADSSFANSMGLAFLFSPLLFFASGQIVRRQTNILLESERKQEEAKKLQQAEQIKRQQEQLERSRLDERAQAYDKTARADIIKKLGGVSDALDALQTEAARGHEDLLKNSIATELREVLAKYPAQDLHRFIQADPIIRVKVKNLAQRLRDSNIDNEDIAMLHGMASQ